MTLHRIFSTFPPLVRFFVLLGLAALTACTAPGPRPQQTVAPATLATAERRAESGDVNGAADLYLQAAQVAAADIALSYRLRAAELLLHAGDLQRAEAALTQIDAMVVSPDQAYRPALLWAELDLARQLPDSALQRLQAIAADRLPVAAQIRYYQLRAQAYDQSGNHLEEARQRIWLSGMLATDSDREQNQRQIWRALSQLSDQTLVQLRPTSPDVLSGWMELVQISRQYRQSPAQLEQALNDWRQRHPEHPADLELIKSLLARQIQYEQYPDRIAVLLPLSGNLANAAAAIRNGMLAAYYERVAAGTTPELRFYDTGDDPQRVWSLYQQAIQDGARFVIGPLSKPAVMQLAHAGTLDVPVLALNWIQEDDSQPLPANFYQYSLAPEDEASQVAVRAYSKGYHRAVALIPEGTWGDRVFQAFTQRWESLGGETLEVQYYGGEAKTFSDRIRDLLNLDASYARHTQLTRLLGQHLEFEPRRRQDVDFVFMLAQPEQARLLRPLFRFHHAGDLPLYSTSNVYTGTENADRDRDLDDLKFCDIPWLFQATPLTPTFASMTTAWPETMARYPRLFAFGIDAYRLLPYLLAYRQGEIGVYPGVTGILSVDGRGQVHRQLTWAQFRYGIPVVLGATGTDAPVAPDDGSDQPMELKDESNAQSFALPQETGPGR